MVYDDSYGRAHFSNFKTAGMSAQIKEITEATGGVYKRVPQKFHEDRRCLFPNSLETILNSNPNTRVVISTNLYSAIRMYCSQAVVMLLDADVFLVKAYNPVTDMSSAGVSLVSVPQYRKFYTKDGHHANITYMWTALNIMDVPSLPSPQEVNWDCGKLKYLYDGTEIAKEVAIDSGGHTYDWLMKHRPKMKWLDVEYVQDSKDPDSQGLANAWKELYRKNGLLEPEFKSQILGEHFLHLRNAGNWVQAGVRYKNLQPELNKAIIDFIHKRKAEKRGGARNAMISSLSWVHWG